jgi:hypothetical protein
MRRGYREAHIKVDAASAKRLQATISKAFPRGDKPDTPAFAEAEVFR